MKQMTHQVFAIIRHIVVIQHDKYFVIEDTEANRDPHTLYYLLMCQNTVTLKSFGSLKFPWPLSVYHYKGHIAVLNVCSHTCPLTD